MKIRQKISSNGLAEVHLCSLKDKGTEKAIWGLIAPVTATELLTSKLRNEVNPFSVWDSPHFWQSLVKCKALFTTPFPSIMQGLRAHCHLRVFFRFFRTSLTAFIDWNSSNTNFLIMKDSRPSGDDDIATGFAPALPLANQGLKVIIVIMHLCEASALKPGFVMSRSGCYPLTTMMNLVFLLRELPIWLLWSKEGTHSQEASLKTLMMSSSKTVKKRKINAISFSNLEIQLFTTCSSLICGHHIALCLLSDTSI